MHPLLIQQLAKLHMEELQREATTTRFANSAGVSSGKGAIHRVPSRYFSHPVLWYYSDSYKPQADEARGTSCPSKTCRIRSHRPSLRQR